MDFDAARANEADRVRGNEDLRRLALKTKAENEEALVPLLNALGRAAAQELRAHGIASIRSMGKEGWAIFMNGFEMNHDLFVTTAGELTRIDVLPDGMPFPGRPKAGEDGWWSEGGEVYTQWYDYGSSHDDSGTSRSSHVDKALQDAILRRLKDHRDGRDWIYQLDKKGIRPTKKPWRI